MDACAEPVCVLWLIHETGGLFVAGVLGSLVTSQIHSCVFSPYLTCPNLA